MLRIIDFFLQKIGVKLNPYKLKKLIDFGFIFIEKTIVNLDKLYPIYFDFYNEMIEKEIILADISKNKKVYILDADLFLRLLHLLQ